jgi:hypothetical protein
MLRAEIRFGLIGALALLPPCAAIASDSPCSFKPFPQRMEDADIVLHAYLFAY